MILILQFSCSHISRQLMFEGRLYATCLNMSKIIPQKYKHKTRNFNKFDKKRREFLKFWVNFEYFVTQRLFLHLWWPSFKSKGKNFEFWWIYCSQNLFHFSRNCREYLKWICRNGRIKLILKRKKQKGLVTIQASY